MKNISGFFGGGVSTNDTKFIKFANEEISNYKNFNKYLLSKQILIFLILKILKFGIFYKIFIKVLRQAHQKNNLSVLKIVYPSLKFKRISFPSYYFSKISEISKKVIYLQLKDIKNRNQNSLIRKIIIFTITIFLKNLKLKM